MKNIIKQLIIWYIFKYENGIFTVKRRGGAQQLCRVFSKQAYENVVKPAIDCKGIFYTQEQLNRAIEETVKAVNKCSKDSDCSCCYLFNTSDYEGDCLYGKLICAESKYYKCNHKNSKGEYTIEYDSTYEMRSSGMHCTQCGKHGTRKELESEAE